MIIALIAYKFLFLDPADSDGITIIQLNAWRELAKNSVVFDRIEAVINC